MVFALAKAMIIVTAVKGLFKGTWGFTKLIARIIKKTTILSFNVIGSSFSFVRGRSELAKEYIEQKKEEKEREESSKTTEEQKVGWYKDTNTVQEIVPEIVEEEKIIKEIPLSQPIAKGDSYSSVKVPNSILDSEIAELFEEGEMACSLDDLLSNKNNSMSGAEDNNACALNCDSITIGDITYNNTDANTFVMPENIDTSLDSSNCNSGESSLYSTIEFIEDSEVEYTSVNKDMDSNEDDGFFLNRQGHY